MTLIITHTHSVSWFLCYLPCFPSVSIFPCSLFTLCWVRYSAHVTPAASCTVWEPHSTGSTHKPFFFFFCAVFCVSIFLNRSISSSFSFLITCVLCTLCVRLSCYWLFSVDAQVFVTVRQYWPLCLNVVGAGWPDVPVFQGQSPFSNCAKQK